jgi:hypothetical protein
MFSFDVSPSAVKVSERVGRMQARKRQSLQDL